jgi:hypothetical protein
MRRLVSLCLFFSSVAATAQEDTARVSYTDLLNATNEVFIPDSISINNNQWQLNLLDTTIVKNWFPHLLPPTANNRLKNRNYYLAGKITTNNSFDLLIVLEEKKKTDSSSSQVVYLITNKKDGAYIASLEIVVTGIRKKSNFITSSWLYKDYTVVQNSKIIINQHTLAELKHYRINTAGRFILSANY